MRPDGWRNPHKKDTVMTSTREGAKYRVYEAGADAMLEGLKKHSLHAEYLEDFIISTAVKADKDWAEDFYENMPAKGYLVFIPEEKNDTGND